MFMQTKQLVAVAVVVIVCIAAVGYMVLGNLGGDDSVPENNTGRLMIYGNADNNDYLDERDISTLRQIIDREIEATPLSDANQDGVVDEEDTTFTQRLIDREPGTVFYQSYYDEELQVQSCDYPVGTICTCGTNVSMMMKALGVVDRIELIDGGNRDTVLFSDFLDKKKASNSVLKADIEIVSDSNVEAIVTEDSSSYIKNFDAFETAGVDVIRLSSSNAERSVGSILTIGYLMQAEERSHEYVKFCDDILADVAEKLQGVDESSKVSALSVTMSNSISGLTSDYYASLLMAGATCPADWTESTKKFEIGDEWLLDPKYQTDYIIHFRTTLGYEPLTDADKQEMWDTYSQYYHSMDAYKDGNYVILSSSMPVHLRVAYLVSIFYPDIFGDDYGDKLHQEYIDRFIDNLAEQDYRVVENPYYLISSGDVTF